MADELDILRSGRTEYQHPKLRYWLNERTRHPERSYHIELLRPKQGLTFGPARLYLHILDEAGSELREPDEMVWDADLDEAFIQSGFRAIHPENEVMRFSLAIRRSFERPERRYGEGFFNAVLLLWVTKSPFASRLQPIVAEISQRSVPEGSEAFTDCSEQIQAAMVRRADDLTERLRWDRPSAARILGDALGAYLDERFNVSNRVALGLGRATG